jgi:demethylmenaquinone methyltransferase/2-methoxy-6-polyprenyl-1,4-benzoquinol methylase
MSARGFSHPHTETRLSAPTRPETNPGATLQGEQKARYVSGMFARIARRYDLMNALMSFGRDGAWRRFVVNKARPKRGGLALDVATGTGRIAQEIAQRGTRAVGIDFSAAMMAQGRAGGVGAKEPVFFAGADALRLPFDDDTFDCATTGFAMRNVTDIESAFREMRRVVRPGARIVCLEVGRPRFAPAGFFHNLYTRRIIPFMGRLIAGDSDAYTYLPSSMGKFPPPEELARIMERAGIRNVRWKQLTFGAVAVHWGIK